MREEKEEEKEEKKDRKEMYKLAGAISTKYTFCNTVFECIW